MTQEGLQVWRTCDDESVHRNAPSLAFIDQVSLRPMVGFALPNADGAAGVGRGGNKLAAAGVGLAVLAIGCRAVPNGTAGAGNGVAAGLNPPTTAAAVPPAAGAGCPFE